MQIYQLLTSNLIPHSFQSHTPFFNQHLPSHSQTSLVFLHQFCIVTPFLSRDIQLLQHYLNQHKIAVGQTTRSRLAYNSPACWDRRRQSLLMRGLAAMIVMRVVVSWALSSHVVCSLSQRPTLAFIFTLKVVPVPLVDTRGGWGFRGKLLKNLWCFAVCCRGLRSRLSFRGLTAKTHLCYRLARLGEFCNSLEARIVRVDMARMWWV